MKLPPKWEENLRRGVIKVGQWLEVAVTKAESVRARKSLGKVAPVLSLEGQIPTAKVKELLHHISLQVVSGLLPPLIDKSVLLIGDGVAAAAPLCADKGASALLQVELAANESSLADHDTPMLIHSHAQKLGVASQYFDTAIAFLATPLQGDFAQVLAELSRCVVLGGEMIIVDFHPFGHYARKGAQRLRPAETSMRGLEDYYRLAQDQQIMLSECREGFCDERARAFFITPDEKQLYRSIKDDPLVIAFRGRKLG